MSPPVALALGILFAVLVELPIFAGHPYKAQSSKVLKYLLQVSVVGLGFGLNIENVIQAGLQGFWFTVATIVGTLTLGMMLGRWLGVSQTTSKLVSVGTAICGGSAIAAVAPVIEANDTDISISLAIVFVLNALALFLFPVLGTLLHLSEAQFGVWSAVAIHDTSSVVGAAARFGNDALATATTIKLSRALWIIPVALGFAWSHSRKQNQSSEKPATQRKITIPYFIAWFVAASLARTFVPTVADIAPKLIVLAKAGLTITLFLIGAGLSKKAIFAVGIRPFVQGVMLWLAISATTLWFVLRFV